MKKTTVCFFGLLLLALCAAEELVADAAMNCGADGKHCPPAPEDECHKPPHLCLARPYCVNLVIGMDYEHPVGKVCIEIDKDRKWIEAIYDVDCFQREPVDATIQTDADCEGQPPHEQHCRHWKLLSTAFWISPDFDSVPTNPAGAPLPSKFPKYPPGNPIKLSDTKWKYHMDLDKVLGKDYDIHRICFDILWFAAHAHLVCEGEDEGEPEDEECASAWGWGEPFQEIHRGEPMYNYVQILCDEECRMPHEKPYCATSYALATHDCPDANSKCFPYFRHDLINPGHPNRPAMWGWVNKITKEGHYTFDLFAGGHECYCNPNKPPCECDMGKLVGNVYVDVDLVYERKRGEPEEANPKLPPTPKPNVAHVMVRFVTMPCYYIQETDVWVDNKEPLPNFKYQGTCQHASFPGWWPMDDKKHEQLYTRIDEFFIKLPKHPDTYKGFCDDHDKREEPTEATPTVTATAEPTEHDILATYKEDAADYNRKPTCDDLSEIFVVAHAMVCEGRVLSIPDPRGCCEHRNGEYGDGEHAAEPAAQPAEPAPAAGRKK
eukprot:TRINITY_DN2091_c0_g3_i1.p1 TRINITY_DN2091_c0_g3~~TRINITY_DN2091_c0_g3_i1.p1  ORF type:complete len:548 (-),score=169.29 TRINITY_DN2091_c0_g3_i1:91-1734(-)